MAEKKTSNANANPAPVTTNMATAAPEGWDDMPMGFPPYWQPEEGKTFRGKVLSVDASDPEFVRFTLVATAPVKCARGPADDQTDVNVAVGELFTCSSYVQLPLEHFMGLELWAMAMGERPLKGGKTTWDFKVKCSSETKALVEARKAKLLAEAEAAIPSS